MHHAFCTTASNLAPRGPRLSPFFGFRGSPASFSLLPQLGSFRTRAALDTCNAHALSTEHLEYIVLRFPPVPVAIQGIWATAGSTSAMAAAAAAQHGVSDVAPVPYACLRRRPSGRLVHFSSTSRSAGNVIRTNLKPGKGANAARLRISCSQASVEDLSDTSTGPAVGGIHKFPAPGASIEPDDSVEFRVGFNPVASLLRATKNALLEGLQSMVFKETDEPPNFAFMGNYAPVAEIGERVAAQVVAGAVPNDFPPGVHIRNGPNPQLGAKRLTSAFGAVDYHAFDGDGMLHATFFEKGGAVSYLNRYVGTTTYAVEKARGKRIWMPAFEGEFPAVCVCFLFNLLRFGRLRVTGNTSVFEHAGKYYAAAESHLPHQFTLPDLTTSGVWDGRHRNWNHQAFTAHPLHDPQTKELIFFCFNVYKPYAEIGILSADGDNVVHTIDLGLDRCVLSHDMAITRRYNIFFDFPLVFGMESLKSGAGLLGFLHSASSRVGILPRYGDTDSIKWFPVETGLSWHKLNSFEEGDEVVIVGLRSRRSILPSPPGIGLLEWWARGTQLISAEDAEDPSVDGALCQQIHEWRFNMRTGESSERNLSKYSFSGEYLTINRSYIGRKNKYGYMCVIDAQESTRCASPMRTMRGWVKMTLPQSADQDMTSEMHQLGPGWGASELSFVARPGAQEEDDGWVVGYVHDEANDVSYLYIIDAQNFTGEPVAKVQLPQRVPYGFHGTYFCDQ